MQQRAIGATVQETKQRVRAAWPSGWAQFSVHVASRTDARGLQRGDDDGRIVFEHARELESRQSVSHDVVLVQHVVSAHEYLAHDQHVDCPD